MANFVKWRGAFNDQGSPSIHNTIQSTTVGQAFRFGIWGGSGLSVGPNNPATAQMNPRETVEGSTNNIIWYELLGLREGNVMIEARNPGDGAVWSYFQLAVKAQAKKVRPAVRGINYDYAVDTKGIGPRYNASMILKLNIALIQIAGGQSVKDSDGTSYISRPWGKGEWDRWVWSFKSVIEKHWSEKYWLRPPSTLGDLDVAKPGGGRCRVNLHCVLKLAFVQPAQAQHRIKVVKSGSAPAAYRSDSTDFDNKDVKTDPPSVTGFAQPFNTVVHEIGHTIGLHHPCETRTPAAPYCAATDPDSNEIMGMGSELRPRYATPWQNAAASWFNSDGSGKRFAPADFAPSLNYLAPLDI